MPTETKIFHWQGIDQHGFKISGEFMAGAVAEVKDFLAQKHIVPLRIKTKKNLPSLLTAKKITPTQITQFSREIATLIAAGIPLAKTLAIIAENTNHKTFHSLLLSLQKNIEHGRLLSESLQAQPQYFDSIMCNLIHVGEQSGMLELILQQIAEHREKMAALKQKIKKAFYYPLIVLITASLITLALLIFVIPQFSQLFAGLGAELPAFTRGIIAITEYLRHDGMALLLTIIAIGISLKIALSRSVRLQCLFAQLLLKIPICGTVQQEIIFVRCFKTLALTLRAGIPLLNALQLTAKISAHPLYESIWLKIADKICSGASLQAILSAHRYFPNRAIQMIIIGEESGRLEHMLTQLSEYYAAAVDHFVAHLNQVLEPAIMIFLAIVIGALVIAVYLPIFQLGSVI